jgi:single-strand DNA-binding protein
MNHINLLGRLTKMPELKYTASNKAVCSFTLAVNRKFKKDEADFLPCQAWDKTAELIAKHFTKGSQIAVSGRVQTRTWDDNDGKKHYVTEVIVEEFYFVGEKKNEQADEDYEPDTLPF